MQTEGRQGIRLKTVYFAYLINVIQTENSDAEVKQSETEESFAPTMCVNKEVEHDLQTPELSFNGKILLFLLDKH